MTFTPTGKLGLDKTEKRGMRNSNDSSNFNDSNDLMIQVNIKNILLEKNHYNNVTNVTLL